MDRFGSAIEPVNAIVIHCMIPVGAIALVLGKHWLGVPPVTLFVAIAFAFNVHEGPLCVSITFFVIDAEGLA